jgi:hypothetical protein
VADAARLHSFRSEEDGLVLRRADNVGMRHHLGLLGVLTGKGWLIMSVGQYAYRVRKIDRAQYRAMWEFQETLPTLLLATGGRNYWLFQGKFYWDDDELTREAVHAVLVTRDQRRAAYVDRAIATVAMGSDPRVPTTDTIPDDVKQLVWARDKGRCVSCGSTTELQFDHAIPRSKGGTSKDEANIQILCGPCNRRKRDGLTTG